KSAATALVGVGGSYAAGKLTNTPTTFRWRDVAVSFAASSLYGGLGKETSGVGLLDNGVGHYLDQGLNRLPDSGFANVARDAVKGITSAALAYEVGKAVYNTDDYRPDYVGVMAGVLGGALGGLALA